MKWVLVLVNVAAAIGLIILAQVAVAAHQAHAYSTYHELQVQGVLREREGDDIAVKLQQIAAGGSYSTWIAFAGAGACLINAAAIAALVRKPPA
jgi:hypothetical protein